MVCLQFMMITELQTLHNQDDTLSGTVLQPGHGIMVNSQIATLIDVQWNPRWLQWAEILREAENNPALDDLIKKAEMVYALTR